MPFSGNRPRMPRMPPGFILNFQMLGEKFFFYDPLNFSFCSFRTLTHNQTPELEISLLKRKSLEFFLIFFYFKK
jgi:hypothetical protein